MRLKQKNPRKTPQKPLKKHGSPLLIQLISNQKPQNPLPAP
jgi:hypothetical protein